MQHSLGSDWAIGAAADSRSDWFVIRNDYLCTHNNRVRYSEWNSATKQKFGLPILPRTWLGHTHKNSFFQVRDFLNRHIE